MTDIIPFRRDTRPYWALTLLVLTILAFCAAGSYGAELSGYGLLQGGDRNNRLSDAQISHSKVSFYVLRDRWSRQEPKNDVFDFSYNAAQIRRCRQAKKGYVVALMTGMDCSPSHVPGPRQNGKLLPWAPAIPSEYGKAMQALANSSVDGVKVKDDPYCLAVWCTGCTVPSQEMHLNGMNSVKGYIASAMAANWKGCINATYSAFPNKPGILSLSGQKPVQAYQGEVIAHMKMVYGSRAIFQHNSLGPQTSVTAPHHRLVLDLGRQGFTHGAEMVSPGATAGLVKFPERDYAVLYSGDERAIR